MAAHLKAKKTKTLPIVFPLLFYHGRRPYSKSMDIFELFGDQKALAQQIFLKPITLVDMTKYTDSAIAEHGLASPMEFLAKNIWERDLLSCAKDLSKLFSPIENRGETEYIETLIEYAITAGTVSDIDRFISILKEGLTPQTGEKIMTIAEELTKRGWDKGMEKGMEKGRTEGIQVGLAKGHSEGRREEQYRVAKRLLAAGADLTFIADTTGLSQAELQSLREKEEV